VLFPDTESARLADLIKDGARAWSMGELQWVRDYAASHKPDGYDAHAKVVVDLYEGNGEAHLLAAAKDRFENRHSIMTPVPLNRMRQVCAADSGVYRLQPSRSGVSKSTGAPVADDVAKRLATLIGRTQIASIAPEVERRVIGAQTVFVKPRWQRGLGKPGRIAVDVFWPRDVAVVCHPTMPDSLDAAVILLARTGSTAGKDWFALWVRTPVEDEFGNVVEFSPWRVHVVSSQGDYSIPPNDPRTLYVDAAGKPLPLPWTVVRLGLPSGNVFVAPDRDLPKMLLGLSVDASAERLNADLLATTPLVYKGDQRKAADIPFGTGEMMQVGEGEDITTLQLNPHLEEMRGMRAQFERDLAKSRDNNPNAYVAEAGQPESGIARLIAQAPHEAKLDEHSLVFRDWEQEQFWPSVLRLHDAFSGEVPFGDDIEVRVTMRRAPPIEEPEAKGRRLQAEYDAGVISLAQMAVELGRYADVADAKKAGLSDELGKKAPTSPLFNLGEPAPDGEPAPAAGGGRQ